MALRAAAREQAPTAKPLNVHPTRGIPLSPANPLLWASNPRFLRPFPPRLTLPERGTRIRSHLLWGSPNEKVRCSAPLLWSAQLDRLHGRREGSSPPRRSHRNATRHGPLPHILCRFRAEAVRPGSRPASFL